MSFGNAGPQRLTLAAVLLIGGTASPCLAEPLTPVELTIQSGEVREVDLSLGSDDRPDLALRAEILPAGDPPWPDDGDLEIGFPEGDRGGLAGLTMVPFSPAGRRLRLRASAAGCCERGTFEAQVRLTPLDASTGAYLGSSLVQPVLVTVLPRSHCGLLIAKLIGGTLMIGLACFGGRTIYQQSHFLSASALAGKLRPQMWGPYGDPTESLHQQPVVLEEVKYQLRAQTWARFKAWLRSNPLRIGIPGRPYQETFLVTLGKKHLSLEVTGQLRRPEKGALLARATASGVVLSAVADENGRISRLRVEPRVNPGAAVTLRGFKLLDPEPDEDSTHAGWRT